MLSENKWMRKAAGLLPVTVIAAMLMSACGGSNNAQSTTAPTVAATSAATVAATAEATAMEATTVPTSAVMEPTAMATAMTTAMPGETGTPGDSTTSLTVQMKAQNGSGQDGTAILGVSATGDTVVITLNNGTSEPQPAHIHKGTCANLDPSPLVTLSPVVNGKSDTTITGGVTTMVAGQSYAINVHKSAAEASVYVSCGDITAGMTGNETPGAMTTPAMSGETMNVTLNAQNASGESGTAVITKKGDAEVMVSINLSNGTTEPQPAHIHKGTCANLDPSPAFPLTNVVDGKSESEVMVSMSELEKGGYAINVHKSAAEAGTYVACGDITAGMMGSETPGMTMGNETPVSTP